MSGQHAIFFFFQFGKQSPLYLKVTQTITRQTNKMTCLLFSASACTSKLIACFIMLFRSLAHALGSEVTRLINFPYCTGFNRSLFKYQCPDHPFCFVLLFVFVFVFFFANLNCSSQAKLFTTENYINFRRKETFLKVQQNFRYACLSTKTFSEGKKSSS